MNEALIIVAVVAVVAIVVFIAKSRGRPSTAEVEERAAVAAAPQPQPAPAREEPRAAAVTAAEPAPAVVEEVPAAPAKPKPSEGELRARVEASLGESKRMLDDLRQRAQESEGMAGQVGAGTLEIMAEGLEEVQALAKKKQWSQAKDKADALEAQFRLLMQTASREKSS